MTICPNCQAPNIDQAHFCSKCGSALPTDDIPLPRPDYIPLPEPDQEPELAPPSPETTPATPSTIISTTRKDPKTALILEGVFGAFGFLGIGWIYSGQTSIGVGILVACLVVEFALCTLTVLSSGIALLCAFPIWVIALAASVYYLYRFTQQHPEVFR